MGRLLLLFVDAGPWFMLYSWISESLSRDVVSSAYFDCLCAQVEEGSV